MKLPTNGFRRAMQGGDVTYGLWLGLPDASAAEIAAGAGFDWLLIDHEHSPLEISDILNLLRAVAPYPLAPIVRPVSDDPALLKKLLDIGVLSFLLPMVDSAAQAEAIVRALRYPPAGRRGVGADTLVLARGSRELLARYREPGPAGSPGSSGS